MSNFAPQKITIHSRVLQNQNPRDVTAGCVSVWVNERGVVRWELRAIELLCLSIGDVIRHLWLFYQSAAHATRYLCASDPGHWPRRRIKKRDVTVTSQPVRRRAMT